MFLGGQEDSNHSWSKYKEEHSPKIRSTYIKSAATI